MTDVQKIHHTVSYKQYSFSQLWLDAYLNGEKETVMIFNSVLAEAGIFFSNTIVLDFKSSYCSAVFTKQFLLILWSNLNSSMYQ